MNLILAIIASAVIDSSTIMIGDQTDLHLQVVATPEQTIQWPQYEDELISGIEIVDRTIVDTLLLKDGRVQYDQYLTLTSFKDTLFYIDPIAFAVGADTFLSEGLSLNVVIPFEIDTAMAITDIKNIEKAPIWWWGIFRWVLLALGLAGLGVGAYFAYRKWGYLLNKQSTINNPQSTQPARPCEEVALEKLDIIKAEKVWQTGEVKRYQTQLTDVVREYIAGRFDVSSSEKTSDETLRAMKGLLSDRKDLYDNLKQMLTLADLVKFAKWSTTPDENEQSLSSAYDFVHETTPK
ncbi:MAG: hypothetical protein MJZ58_02845 [Paludibacteraceae bacterium]|nr:hypothetical protein [Paludibacteraceae bacterium]